MTMNDSTSSWNRTSKLGLVMLILIIVTVIFDANDDNDDDYAYDEKCMMIIMVATIVMMMQGDYLQAHPAAQKWVIHPCDLQQVGL